MKGLLRCGSVAVSSPLLPSKLLYPSPFSPRAKTHLNWRKPVASASPSLVIETSEGETTAKSMATRRLIILRHAESSWNDRTIRDHDRLLSKTGRADAISVSCQLEQMGWVPELILSSDAKRTKETLQIMQEHVQGFLEAEVHFIASFYSIAALDGQTAEHLKEAVCEYSKNDIFTVMCMGHNRGWEEAASVFSGSPVELKTCNAALLEASGESWDEAFTLNHRAGLGWPIISELQESED
ncbi:hypothetical protein H6P81_008803 [Aristolochia fimbriata]|uniref:Phosphoglycerate mutase n=1 Tax=Aristolochia fimbriata TaxID=158543 RepID=A0AAV7EJ24_ARIFI|nr:hypothetical protein H6P81_008803 [Aristolochia fimbriata]